MRKQNTMRLTILAALALAALFILRSSLAKPANTKDCKQECCHKKAAPKGDNLIWETFSRQLIFVPF